MPLIICFALIIALILFLICPSLRRHPDRDELAGLYIAHRGLHNDIIPENSLAAFQNAVNHGFAIENDIHLTADGKIVVFHDDTLTRMCGVNKKVEDLTLKELKELRLKNTNEKIPTLEETLKLVDGRVPLLIEFKCPNLKTCKPLCRTANEILGKYKGKYFIQSFFPFVPRWYKKNNKSVLRGQLSSGGFMMQSAQHFLVSNLLINFLSRPDFVSYEYKYKNNFFRRLTALLGALPVCWTLRNRPALKDSKKTFKTYIFENFVP